MTGSLHVGATRRESRTVVDTLRQDGLARSSRPLDEPREPGAARLVVSHLGPGFVRGDRFETVAEIGPRASLVIAAQAATRILGAGTPSSFCGRFRVEENGRLYLCGEPTIAFAGAAHGSTVRVELARGASFATVDAFAPHETFDRVATSVQVRFGGRLALHDALVIRPERLRSALGTAFYLRSGIEAEETEALVAAADDAAARANANGRLRIGVGSPAAGGVALRAIGTHVREVRDALAAIVELLRARDGARETNERAAS